MCDPNPEEVCLDDVSQGEQLLVFAWRMLVAGRQYCPLLEAELSRCAGANAREVLAALNVFLIAISNASRRRISVGHPGCPLITPDERSLLALLGSAASGRSDAVSAHLCWLVRSEHQDTVRTLLGGFREDDRASGTPSAGAGRRIPRAVSHRTPRAAFGVTPQPSLANPQDHEMTIAQKEYPAYLPLPSHPDGTPLAGLGTAELLLTATLRLYAASHLGDMHGPDWSGGLARSGAGCCAVPAFDALFGIVAVAARHPIDVRCRHCTSLSRDEGRFLQLVGLLQHGRTFDARDVLCGWLPPAAMRLAILPAKGLATSLARARLLVPLRGPDLARYSTGLKQQTHPSSTMVH
jgi:hypothetical protein